MYQKEIIYMSLYKNDIKESCVGYLKLEKKQDEFVLELQVKNIPNNISGSFPVRLQTASGWQEADMLSVKGGIGRWTGQISNQVLKIEVILSDYYRIKGQSKNASITDAQKEDESVIIQEQLPKPVEKPLKQESISKPQEPAARPQEKLFEPASSLKPRVQVTGAELPIREAPMIDWEQSANQEDTPLYESKWEQLLAAYEQIHPYGDNRVYVKIKPKDFIILRSNYQHLVNNSFLLHGFYNYRYLILGKEKDFYLGVPGVFYEREKMVALMFGFEAFECEGGNAEEGKFGYYLRKVEI